LSWKYPNAQHEDAPSNNSVRSLSDAGMKLFRQENKSIAGGDNHHTRQAAEKYNWDERGGFFPHWPVEWIVDVIGRLRDKDNVGVLLFL
jgi:hypothetical protein